MKKVAAVITSLGFLASATSAFAAITIRITPTQGIPGGTSLGLILSNALTIIFVVAAFAVLFMLIIGAFQWITSGGDKEAVGRARGRITHALIGLAILALAFLIVTVVGQILNIDILSGRIPSLTETLPALPSPTPIR